MSLTVGTHFSIITQCQYARAIWSPLAVSKSTGSLEKGQQAFGELGGSYRAYFASSIIHALDASIELCQKSFTSSAPSSVPVPASQTHQMPTASTIIKPTPIITVSKPSVQPHVLRRGTASGQTSEELRNRPTQPTPKSTHFQCHTPSP
jgi:hypothetical protein